MNKDAFLRNACLCGGLHFLPSDANLRLAFILIPLERIAFILIPLKLLVFILIPLGMNRSVKKLPPVNLHSIGMQPIINLPNSANLRFVFLRKKITYK